MHSGGESFSGAMHCGTYEANAALRVVVPPLLRGEGGAVRHQRGKSHRRRLIIVMLLKKYECRRLNVEHTLPSRENKNVWKKYRHISPVPFRRHPPLVAGATTFPPAPLGALWVLGILGNWCSWQQRQKNKPTGPQARSACFPLARQGGFKVLSKLAPKAPTTTL